jgi:type II secretory ATPase GspE/PulE/Tfp pilus assembly ATPase PilB-like protein
MDDALRGQLLKSTEATQLKRVAIANGMKTLREDGIDKAIQGVTTLEEVFRVTAEEEGELTADIEPVA